MKRVHFLRNTNIGAFAAKLANTVASINQQTLILVEELNQIKMIADQLRVPYAIAHSEKTKERLSELGLSKVDVQESIEKFNKSEVKVLIGTSCIRTGCNIFPVHHCVNAVGGSSEITTKQGAVGRAVRFGNSNPWAKNCAPKENAIIYDFDVQDIYIMGKHLEERMSYYSESETPIKYVKFK